MRTQTGQSTSLESLETVAFNSAFTFRTNRDKSDIFKWHSSINITHLIFHRIILIISLLLQSCFKLKQSLGVIGGKPNLALYFIGCVDTEVIYLDPHTTQRVGSIENKETEDQIDLDQTYHCKRAARMNILTMDPSIAAVRYFF